MYPFPVLYSDPCIIEWGSLKDVEFLCEEQKNGMVALQELNFT